MNFFRRSPERSTAVSHPSPEGEREPQLPQLPCMLVGEVQGAVETKKENIDIEGKRPLDSFSLATIERAEKDVVAFLEKLGFQKAAGRIRGLASSGGFFLFDGVVLKSLYGEERRVTLNGFFSAEFAGIGIDASLTQEQGHQSVRHTGIHEMIHVASFSVAPDSIRTYTKEGRQALRIQSGFGVTVEEVELQDAGYFADKTRFTFLNEGMTEVIRALIDGSQLEVWNGYNVHRLAAHLLLRAFTKEKQKQTPTFSLKDAAEMFLGAYFERSFDFGKELDALLGKGTLREIAHVESDEQAETLVRRLATSAGYTLHPDTFSLLDGEELDSSAHKELEKMDTELLAALTAGKKK